MANLSPLRVFDHDSTTVEVSAVNCDFTTVDTTESGNAKDEQAATLLLEDPHWKFSLVHIHDGPWERLCKGTRKGQVIVRFSSQGFGCVRPQGTHALCLHCLKKPGQIEESDIKSLVAVLLDEFKQEQIRSGLIDSRIRHLINFTEPHRLRGLHILLQGVLAIWASDLANPHGDRARTLLKVPFIPTLPGEALSRCAQIWKYLGLEVIDSKVLPKSADELRSRLAFELGMKVEEFGEVGNAPIRRLVDFVCAASPDDTLDPIAVINGFEAIDAELKR